MLSSMLKVLNRYFLDEWVDGWMGGWLAGWLDEHITYSWSRSHEKVSLCQKIINVIKGHYLEIFDCQIPG